MEGARVIPGSSTIHFDEISKKRIYASIDTARTNDMKLLKESYTTLKYKLGRIPTIRDFKEFGSIDVTKIFEKCGSYYGFLKKYETGRADYWIFFEKTDSLQKNSWDGNAENADQSKKSSFTIPGAPAGKV